MGRQRRKLWRIFWWLVVREAWSGRHTHFLSPVSIFYLARSSLTGISPAWPQASEGQDLVKCDFDRMFLPWHFSTRADISKYFHGATVSRSGWFTKSIISHQWYQPTLNWIERQLVIKQFTVNIKVLQT